MRVAITSKTILAAAAISFLAFMLVPIPSVRASSPSCSLATTISGVFVSPPPPGSPSGTWVQTFTNPPIATFQIGALIKGASGGTFTVDGISLGSVTAFWSFDTATGKVLMKVIGVGFYVDYAFLNLPSGVGFTFQGMLHIVGMHPEAMAESPLVVPVTCSS